MARKLTFHGESDDLFEVGGTKGGEPDEMGCYNRVPCVRIYDKFGNAVRVFGYYASNGCWGVGLCPDDEDRPIPDWPVSIKLGGRGYSAVLTMEAPDDAVVVELPSEKPD